MMQKYKLKKGVREVVQWAEARGWRLQPRLDGGDHVVLRHPRTGAKMTLPSTTSNRRMPRNAMAKMKRLERGDG